MSKNYMNDSQASEIMKFISDTMKFPVMGAGGGFAPIGTEAYFDGQVAPLGWVICDGTELNIADYPDLATYYASQHGASNYYGGNGTTTFATPKRSGMPTSGVETPDEHIIGEWRETVDGVLKKKPVYEKMCNIENTISWPSKLSDYPDQTFLSNLNIENLIESEAFGHCASSIGVVKDPLEIAYYEGVWKWRFYEGWGNMTSTHIKFQYTKTTDTYQAVQEGYSADGNGIFCVKATVSDAELNAFNVYTPREHQVAWWEEEIDGVWKRKPVYERTVQFYKNNAPASGWNNSGGHWYYTDFTANFFELLLDAQILIQDVSGNLASDLSLAKSSTFDLTWYADGYFNLNFSTNYNNWFVFTYTKTSDKWQTS